MSELSAEEKKRILRERRQAKMAKGLASARLNSILTQGSLVKADSAVSVLDRKLDQEAQSESALHDTNTLSGETPNIQGAGLNASTTLSQIASDYDDPEVPDINTLSQPGEEEDMEAMMAKIFGVSPGLGGGDPMSQMFEMMKSMNGEGSEEFDAPQELSYQTKLAKYQAYQQKSLQFKFLVVRFVVHISNFVYHCSASPTLRASSHFYTRSDLGVSAGRQFFNVFLALEIAIVSSYFMVMSLKGLLHAFTLNHFLSRILSLGSSFLPQVNKYKPLVDTALVYWSGVNIVLGDVMLVVVLFGLTSIVR